MADPFRSERLLYRAVDPTEDEAFFVDMAKDGISYRNSNAWICKPQSKAEAQRYIKYVHEEALIGVIICLPAQESDSKSDPKDKPKPTPVGVIHLSPLDPKMVQHRFTEIGITISGPYQGKGYGGESIRWILEWAFETAGMHRVGLRSFEYNTGAIKLYKKLGFKEESRIREMIWGQGRWWDDMGLGMLEREWRALRDEGKM